MWSFTGSSPWDSELSAERSLQHHFIESGDFSGYFFAQLGDMSLNVFLSLDIFLYLYFPAMHLTMLGGIVQPLLYLHKAGKHSGKITIDTGKLDVFSSWDNFLPSYWNIFSLHQVKFFCYIDIFVIFKYFLVILRSSFITLKKDIPTHKTYTVSQPGRVETLNNIILTLYTPSTISTMWIQFRPVTLCPMCVTSACNMLRSAFLGHDYRSPGPQLPIRRVSRAPRAPSTLRGPPKLRLLKKCHDNYYIITLQ